MLNYDICFKFCEKLSITNEFIHEAVEVTYSTLRKSVDHFVRKAAMRENISHNDLELQLEAKVLKLKSSQLQRFYDIAMKLFIM